MLIEFTGNALRGNSFVEKLTDSRPTLYDGVTGRHEFGILGEHRRHLFNITPFYCILKRLR
ncbi:MAG: hypothetical protein NVS1B6_18590 [Steroidobacteraceae bacterium]